MQGVRSDACGVPFPTHRDLMSAHIRRAQHTHTRYLTSSGSTFKQAKMSETYDKINATAESFVASYEAAFRTKDATKVSQILTPECTRTMQPRTFAETLRLQHNPITVADYEAIVQSELPALEFGHIDMGRPIVDIQMKQASFKADIHVELKDGTKDILEFMFLLAMTDSCGQVEAVVQFADTAKINDVVAKTRRSWPTNSDDLVRRVWRERGTCTTVMLRGGEL